MKKGVLVFVPDFDKTGGVSAFCSAVAKHFPGNYKLFIRGFRADDNGVVKKMKRFVSDNLKLSSVLKNDDIKCALLNTSISRVSLIRDGLFILNLKNKKKDFAVFFHGWNFDKAQKYFEGFFFGKFLDKTFMKADKMFVLSNQIKEFVRSTGYNGEIVTGTTAVDADLTEGTVIDEILKKYDTETNPVKVLMLSRLEKQKGIYKALDAFAILEKKYNNLRLTIAGEGSQSEQLKKYANDKKMNNVEFTGLVTGAEKKKVFMDSHIFFFPSDPPEGMPVSVLEAMSFGLPVAGGYIGGIKDFFVEGEMGFISNQRTPESYAEILEKLVSDKHLMKNMSKTNFEFARERFSSETVAHRILSQMENLSNENVN